MWLGAAAGLALFPFFLARLVHARNVSFTDQELSYDGQDWRALRGPLECAGISQSVHSTNNLGDDLTVDFTGNAVYVFGPREPLSNTFTIFLDDEVQPVSPTIDTDGCSVLYRNTNIANGQHSLYIVYSDSSGSSTLGISGVTVTLPDLPLASPTVAPLPASTVPSVPTASSVPTTSPSSEPINAAPSSTNNTDSSSNATASGVSPPSSSESTDAVSTSGFITPSGMTASLIGAIVGVLLGMVALLLLFIFIRRRITRNAARKKENNSGRSMEEGTGKEPADEAYRPSWSKSDKLRQSEAGPSDLEDGEGSAHSAHFSSTMVTISHASHGSDGLFTTSSHRTPSTTYTVDFGSALLNRAPSAPEPSGSARHTPTHLTIPIPIIDASSLRSLEVSTTAASHPNRTPTSAFSSSSATRGSDAHADPKARGGERGAHAVNKSGSFDSSTRTQSGRGSDPPPGFL